MININENLNITRANNSKLRRVSLILILSFILMFLFSNISFALVEWNGKDSAYNNGQHGHGVFLDVKNRRTGKHYDGIYHSSYESNLVVENGDFKYGDILDCHAFTCYVYGEYKVYKGSSVSSLKLDEHYTAPTSGPEDLYWTVTIDSKVTKIYSSTDANRPKQYWVSVLIYSTGDETPPEVSVDKTKVLQGTNVTITGTDNENVVGYKVTSSSVKPTSGFTNFSGGSKTRRTASVTCNTLGTFYAWVIDETGNISNSASFTVGTAPGGYIVAPAVKEGATVTYSCIVNSGTAPYTSYQWYVNGSIIPGATGTTYNYTGNKAHNGKSVVCAVGNGYATTNITGTVTVYYQPVVSAKVTAATQVVSNTEGHVKKAGKATMVASVTTAGNPNTYTYQWYKSSVSSLGGTPIVGATSSSYDFYPTENQTTYFYCKINNTQYDTYTNSVLIKADVTEPTVKKGTPFDENIYVNRNVAVTIPLIVSDTGHGFTTSNFKGSQVVVKVNGTTVSPTKTLTYKSTSGTNYYYDLKLVGLTGNGKLSFEIPANSFTDDYGNGNIAYAYSTNVEVDNIDPVIYFSKIISGQREGYIAQKHSDLVIELYINEKIGINTNEFTATDVGLKAITSGSPASAEPLAASYSKTLQYVRKEGTNYYYRLTLSHIPGDGQLYVYVPTNSIKDWATNGNGVQDTSADKTGQNIKVVGVIIDNTPPTFLNPSVTMKLESDEGAAYPSSLEGWHEGWTNKSVYMTVNAKDDNGMIDYYTCSKDNKVNFYRLLANKEHIDNDYNQNVYFRVYDKAENMSETNCLVQIDKTDPAPTKILIHEERPTGALYVFNKDKPINKTLYSIADKAIDLGKPELQSGVKIDKGGLSDFISYYEITKYNNIDEKILDTAFGTNGKKKMDLQPTTPAFELPEDGYYEITTITYDKAGNYAEIKGDDTIKFHIKKRTNNVIKLKNLDDIGSGLDRAVVTIYNGTSADPENVLKQSTITDLYKEYTMSVTLNKGSYLVEVKLYDKVNNETTLSKIIQNSL